MTTKHEICQRTTKKKLPILQEHQIERVFIIGSMVEGCLSKTALGSIKKGYQTLVLKNETAAFSPEGRNLHFEKMKKMKVGIINTADLDSFFQ